MTLENRNLYLLLADLVLIVHFALVLFNIGGFLFIWIGHFLHWRSVRNFAFRMTHLLAMGFIAWQAVAQLTCPLTTWENQLRTRAGQAAPYTESFIEHWLGRILFYDLNQSAFTILYIAFFALIVVTFWKVPPRWPQKFSRKDPP
jgi:hypothetical protein